MAGESRYVLEKPGGAELTLPPSTIVVSGDGETLQYELIRAVEASEWEEVGDGEPIPTPLVLEMVVEASSEGGASALATAIWSFARLSYRIKRDGRVYRTLRRAKSCTVQHVPGDAQDQRLAMILLPSNSKWRSLADDTERLF